MVEESLYTYMKNNLDSSLEISYGKVKKSFNYNSGNTTVSFFKLPSESSVITPSYLDNFQITVRNRKISDVQPIVNDIINLFHLYSGIMGSYRVRVIDVSSLGTLYEEEDLVSIPINLSIKYTGL